jgi:hypothetical protein
MGVWQNHAVIMKGKRNGRELARKCKREYKNKMYSKTFSAVIMTYPKQINNFFDY